MPSTNPLSEFISQHIQSRSIYNEAENYCVRVEHKNEKTKEPKKFVLVLGNNRIYFFKPAGKVVACVLFVLFVLFYNYWFLFFSFLLSSRVLHHTHSSFALL